MKKKKGFVTVLVTAHGCKWDDRKYQPGETATVPLAVAREWNRSQRATLKVAEVVKDDIWTHD